MKRLRDAANLLRIVSFSILNGSNGNETLDPLLQRDTTEVFQYPQRIEWQ